MYINKILSYGGAYNNLIENYSDDFIEIKYIISEIDKPSLISAYHSQSLYFRNTLSNIVNKKNLDNWNSINSDSKSRLNISQVGLINEHNISIQLIDDSNTRYLNWLYSNIPFSYKNKLIDIPILFVLNRNVKRKLHNKKSKISFDSEINSHGYIDFEKIYDELNSNNYEVFIKINDELKQIVKEYLSYFNLFVKRKKQEIINFQIIDKEDGLTLDFRVETETELEDIKEELFEYINFTQKSEDEIIPTISQETTEKNKILMMFELKEKVRGYHHKMESTKDKLKVIQATLGIPYEELDFLPATTLIKGIKEISSLTPNATINLSQNQNQLQYQEQEQYQKLKNHIVPMACELHNLSKELSCPILKEEAQNIVDKTDSISINPTEEKVEESGILPKVKRFMDKVKETAELVDTTKDSYNKLATHYNGLASAFGIATISII